MKSYWVPGIIIFVALIFAGCDATPITADASQPKTEPASGPKTEKPSPVRVVTARHQVISREIEATGDVVAANRVTIRSSVEGPISWFPWREGDAVKKGERLVEIDRPVYREEVRGAEAALAVARARLADFRAGTREEEVAQAAETVRQLESCAVFAETDLTRVDQLVKTGALPEESLEKARVAFTKCETGLTAARARHRMLKAGPTATDLAVQQALVSEAEARLDMARARLAECVIHAPFDGVVAQVEVRPGDLAQAKAPLLTLIETASIVVRFSLPESGTRTLNGQIPVSAVFDALPGRSYPARIVRVYPEIDPRTRTRTVEARVEDAAELVPGMFARLAVVVESSEACVVLPDRALLTRSGGDPAAFVVVDGAAERRTVKTGIENGSCIQVVEGVRSGEQVIVAGHEKIKNGAPIKAEPFDGDPCPAPKREGVSS
ncbi:MAG: efflux RND transporter periplasmic adaptor subunit [Thermodesulfobacteriota bacterium]